jgi:hypothetical protein
MSEVDPNFNPAYSTIKGIYFRNQSGTETLNIIRQNTECVFEKIEFVENVNDVLPNGVLVVKDTKDIVSRLKEFEIDRIIIEFFDSTLWYLDITSVSYLNNAASDTEENFVGIYFSNQYYKLSQQKSLNQSLGVKKPNVYKINDFVELIGNSVLRQASGSYNDPATNYVLYKPLNTTQNRNEAISDNPIEYLNYLTTNAVAADTNAPTFMFWTDFAGNVNFKSFNYNLDKDASFSTIDADYRRFGVFEGDSVIQQLSDKRFYRKIYFYNTDPAYQFISKNYYYIRKTPKLLDSVPPGLCADSGQLDQYNYNTLSYQFQDEGQRYNIEVINQTNTGNAIPGSDQLFYTSHWGYYDGVDSIDRETTLTNISQDFGTRNSYKQLNLMGSSGYMQYVDNTEMWKNMFDITPVHPDIPNTSYVIGSSTNLQKVIDGRYNAFIQGLSGSEKQLEQLRQIELQNFVAYSLCCMGSKQTEDCFFALLTRYEIDCTKGYSGAGPRAYRYQWRKLEFDTTGLPSGMGATGCVGPSGPSGAKYFHQVENWSWSGERSSYSQDNSWAINLNERGITGDYYPPGWVAGCLPTGFAYRPIGAKERGFTAEEISHVAKLCKYTDGLNVMYYFIAENVVDGCCDTP